MAEGLSGISSCSSAGCWLLVALQFILLQACPSFLLTPRATSPGGWF